MLKTSTRLLQLLTLLQVRRSWTGPELSRELEVTTRTVRNDVERLRELGYPVQASPGVEGGYRLGAGAELPPLLLDQDEAVAVAIGLSTAVAAGLRGIEETSLRALGKLEQVMPTRVRRRFQSVQRAIVAVPRLGPSVDTRVLTTIAAACRDNERLRFDYRSHDGTDSARDTEPHRVVHDGRRWYLVAWDRERADWRTFRVDRMSLRAPVGPRFVPRPPPDGDVVAHLSRGVERATWNFRATLRVHAPAADVARRVPAAVAIEAIDEQTCVARVGSDSPEMLAPYLGMLGADFEVLEPPALRRHLRALGERYLRAGEKPSQRSRQPRRRLRR